jgi:hypothetical protein
MRAPLAYPRTTAANEFDTEEREYTSEQLVSNGRAMAVTTAADLFARFGWAVSEDLLRKNLDQLFTRR